MTLSETFGYLGTALGYAVLSGLPVSAAATHFGGRFSRTFPLVLGTLFFFFLAVSPFPSRDLLVCPVPAVFPQLIPGRFLTPLAGLWHAGVPPLGWITNTYAASIIMNLLVCGMIGAGWLWSGRMSLSGAIAFGFALSLTIELTQLTGLWDLYPCAYRQFDVDDVILNVAGVVLGFLIARRVIGSPSG